MENFDNITLIIAAVAFLGINIVFWKWFLYVPATPPPYVPEPTTKKVELLKARQSYREALKSTCPKTGDSYLVIGGGFLGSRIIESLLMRGETKVTVVDLNSKIAWASDSRVSFIQCDITSKNSEATLNAACRNITTVYLTAAVIRYMDSLPHQWEASYAVNVRGTENVLNACKFSPVTRHVIQTSTSHVNINSSEYGTDEEWEEDMPLVSSETATSHYALSKALGEKLMLDANGMSDLKTVSLRPGGVYGSKDHLLMQSMVRDGFYVFLDFAIHIDWVYVDNVAYAHLLAEAKLRSPLSAGVAGHSFNVTNEDPMANNLFRHMIKYYMPEVKMLYLPQRLFWLISYGVDALNRILKNNVPDLRELKYLTPTVLRLLRMKILLSPTRSRDVLGYKPIFSVDTGIQLAAKEMKGEGSIFDEV